MLLADNLDRLRTLPSAPRHAVLARLWSRVLALDAGSGDAGAESTVAGAESTVAGAGATDAGAGSTDAGSTETGAAMTDGDGAVQPLRVSPHRTVLRVEEEAQAWLLKIVHPSRAFEGLRAWMRPPAAIREFRNHERLRSRWPELGDPALVEQVGPALGLFARPWQPGRTADQILKEADPNQVEPLGAQLARLHRHGWSDPDLLAKDLLLDAEGLLRPLDLGQARISSSAAPALAQRADLVLLLAFLTPEEAAAVASPLLQGHGRLAIGSSGVKELLQAANDFRRAALWRHSARCTRCNADFKADPRSAMRRPEAAVLQESGSGWKTETDSTAPEPMQTLAEGRRSQVVAVDGRVRKHYRRRGRLQAWRTRLGFGPGRRAYRWLYLLESCRLPAARVRAWSAASGEWVETDRVAGASADFEHAEKIAAWMGALARYGLRLRDPKPRNFRLPSADACVLVDPDGLRFLHSPREWLRDLGRLAAEVDERHWPALCEAFGQASGLPAIEPDRLRRHAESFRRALARKRAERAGSEEPDEARS